MKLTCEQMDVLISFYIENELNKNVKNAVEEHLKTCFSCKTKYEIIKSLSENITKSLVKAEETHIKMQKRDENKITIPQYALFRKNLSAYIDNELSEKDTIKIKKIVINNKTARKDLENSYKLKHLIHNSIHKTKNCLRQDFSKKILSQLKPPHGQVKKISDEIKLITGFLMGILIISTLVIINLNL